ncbi:MAG TPA: hypothetical protein VN649_00815 [Ramlibacter sp.]|nr:hypothetical protein [Ramlibacter sp.]
MNSRKPFKAKEPGIAWYLVPAVWVAAALAGLVILTYWPALLADQLPAAPERAASNASPAGPHASSDPSVPDASSVFKDHPPPVSEPVNQF